MQRPAMRVEDKRFEKMYHVHISMYHVQKMMYKKMYVQKYRHRQDIDLLIYEEKIDSKKIYVFIYIYIKIDDA